LFLNDFSLRFLGNLSVEQLEQYDDISSWLDLDENDFKGLTDLQKLQSLKDFRGLEWSTRASKWLKNGIPPIVVITAPDEDGMHTQIGDGRGRVNFANIFNKQIPTWHLVYKKKRQKQLENIVYECIEEILTKINQNNKPYLSLGLAKNSVNVPFLVKTLKTKERPLSMILTTK
jgi:hypothetical protein